ncbi:uncharacterized protein E5676_scaffold227G00790 [Cucumis melo var. makuwa]|uniref:Ty1-copia retrotransposon protein n=1 Tax=Cucumis melo var. makuwa TaxID=1194695 RepID=A0A5D3CHF8_CUCMM|nr:uncharacterized protein E5676_scaffold227G00790 [Cucumis melo var. makuwa]
MVGVIQGDIMTSISTDHSASKEYISEVIVPTQNPTEEEIWNHVAWTKSDFIYKNLILNGLTDELYDHYSTMSTLKEVWDAFQMKYDIEETGSNKYVDFKNTLRHKTKEVSLESLINQLRIEEESRKHDQKEEVNVVPRKKSAAIMKLDL